jgi:two-component system cell cycle response regulator
MRNRILTVDDSKTVRIIVKKAFKNYDCEILEAANGVEGLAAAAKESPDLILLDVTMPVMDGIEMLTKLKADPATRGIPVIMLTAEGGRDTVLKIAKIGIRDYIVKPFKEDVLVEKVGRIIELKPLEEGKSRMKSIFDPATILVVDDKPAIIQQISEGLKHTPWKICGVNTTGEAIDFSTKETPDLTMISLALPDESAFTLFRLFRTQMKTKSMPVFGLAVKTETHVQQEAQQIGFNSIVTKPIDLGDLESKIAKAMNLDTSARYFSTEKDYFKMKLPPQINQHVANEVTYYLKSKISEAVDSGTNYAIFDLSSVEHLDVVVIKLLFQSIQVCNEVSLRYQLVGNGTLVKESKDFEDTQTWVFHDSIEAAHAALTKNRAPEAVSV